VSRGFVVLPGVLPPCHVCASLVSAPCKGAIHITSDVAYGFASGRTPEPPRSNPIVAIPFVRAKIISRGGGRSIAAAVAYATAQKLLDERQGLEFDYTRKSGVMETGIAAPDYAPGWVYDTAQLLNSIETAEKRKDARTAREMVIALPHEMTDRQRADLLKDYINDNFTSQGMVAIFAIHEPDREGDNRNYHAHVILTTREITRDGFSTKKNREWDKDEALEGWKENWCDLVNERAQELGIDINLDERSPEERGRMATQHMGEELTAMERKGIKTERGNYNRQAQEYNREMERKQRELEEAQLQLEELLQREVANDQVPAIELIPEPEPPAPGQPTQEISQPAPEPVKEHEVQDIFSPALELTPEIDLPGQQPERPSQPFNQAAGQELEKLSQIFNQASGQEPTQEPERPTQPFNQVAGLEIEQEPPSHDLLDGVYDRAADDTREQARAEIKQPGFELSQDEKAQEQEPEPQAPTLEMQQQAQPQRHKETRQEWAARIKREMAEERAAAREQTQEPSKEPERPTSPFNEAAGQGKRKPGQKLSREEWVEEMKHKGRENDEREEQERRQSRGFDLEM
jgi:MobA/MobL family